MRQQSGLCRLRWGPPPAQTTCWGHMTGIRLAAQESELPVRKVSSGRLRPACCVNILYIFVNDVATCGLTEPFCFFGLNLAVLMKLLKGDFKTNGCLFALFSPTAEKDTFMSLSRVYWEDFSCYFVNIWIRQEVVFWLPVSLEDPAHVRKHEGCCWNLT